MIPSTEVDLLIDLHVLSILSAFILSQDQTLHSISILTPFYQSILTSLLLLLMFSLSSPIRIDKMNITTFLTPLSTTFFTFFILFFFLFFFSFTPLPYPHLLPYTSFFSTNIYLPLIHSFNICCIVFFYT